MSLTGSTKKSNWLQYPAFSPFNGVTAFTTTRAGGISAGPYGSFNLSVFSGDDATAVAANRAAVCASLSINSSDLYIPFQTHSRRSLLVDDAFLALDSDAQLKAMEGIDALITAVPGICIGVTTADCVPLLIYDPLKRVAAVVHAGWRGTVQRIASGVVADMVAHFQSDPATICAVIGPSIGPDAYEVGDEVAAEFTRAGFADAVLSGFDKPHIDLWAANRLDLLHAGLSPQNITVSGICTYTHHGQFFSARRLGIQSGRMVTGMVLRE